MEANDVPLFSTEELLVVTSNVSGGKAPGPDGISTVVLKIIVREFPSLLLNMYKSNTCVQMGLFSKHGTARQR